MYFKSKRISLIILGITSIICSRAMFVLFNDPEGPNLLIVLVTAAIVYFLSLAVYLFNFSISGSKKLSLAILIQVIIVAGLYLCLN
jgi:hypothetical protein